MKNSSGYIMNTTQEKQIAKYFCFREKRKFLLGKGVLVIEIPAFPWYWPDSTSIFAIEIKETTHLNLLESLEHIENQCIMTNEQK